MKYQKKLFYNKFCDTQKKIVDLAQIKKIVIQVKSTGAIIVFTNGCFDLLHIGHVFLLEQARLMGDILIVGLNSDQSVNLLGKGKERPLVPEQQRARIIAALAAVDIVVIYDDPTPLKLIEIISPNILAKGSDWLMHDIIGAQIVLSYGGQVLRIPYVNNISSSILLSNYRKKLNKNSN